MSAAAEPVSRPDVASALRGSPGLTRSGYAATFDASAAATSDYDIAVVIQFTNQLARLPVPRATGPAAEAALDSNAD